jgi:hypothetical protein
MNNKELCTHQKKPWRRDKIYKYLCALIRDTGNCCDYHQFSWDFEDKYQYIYDAECYLMVFPGRIELCSYRQTYAHSEQRYVISIECACDVNAAYQRFKELTQEEEIAS